MTTVLHGDCMDMLPLLPENSIDAVVCDPPYHLQSIVDRFGAKNAAPAKHGIDGAFARASRGFMGETWDGGDIAFRVETWRAVLRVMKPGAYLFACCGPRTVCRVGVAVEDAGFIMHPMTGWIYGQGLPKGHKIVSPEWDGWRYGTQTLKPALEPILVAQKPFSEKTGTANVLRWGTGAFNIEACRADEDRYPANVIHDGSSEGPIAQFFYCAKASTHERAGSGHPTIKPLALMRYLCRLTTPPGGVVLDPFAGSGTTLQAAVLEGFRAIGIEKEEQYVADIVRRMRAA